MEVGVRELRNRTSEVIDAVLSGEVVTLTVHGEPRRRYRSPHRTHPLRPAVRALSAGTRRSADRRGAGGTQQPPPCLGQGHGWPGATRSSMTICGRRVLADERHRQRVADTRDELTDARDEMADAREAALDERGQNSCECVSVSCLCGSITDLGGDNGLPPDGPVRVRRRAAVRTQIATFSSIRSWLIS
jgi:antitoxin (DNA-binding transcriptional repressor) of toxin-antitoxin stability system